MTARDCTCCGPAPGYPMHEWFCGLPEREDDCLCGENFVVAECPDHGWLIDAESQVA